MKKSYLMIAAAAIAMVSCSDTYELKKDLNGSDTNQVAISFETFNNKATKAENSTSTNSLGLENHHLTFSVWGYKDVQDTYVFGTSSTEGTVVSASAAVLYTYSEYKALDGKSAVTEEEFNALSVAEKTKTQAGASWSYSPVRFWDKNSNSYEFYAAAPSTAAWTLNANVAATQNDDYFTLGPVTLADKTLTSTSFSESMKDQDNTDYMIASPKNVDLENYSQTVQLDFNHILSRLNVTVKKGTELAKITPEADAKLKIVDIKVRDMLSTGSFDEHADAVGNTATAATTDRWTTTEAKVTYNACVASATDVTTMPIYVLQSLVIPQKADYESINRDGSSTELKPYLYIEYQIGTTNPETYKAYVNLAAAFGMNGTTGKTAVAFNEGWQNTLNLIIDVDAIVFDPQVYKWDDGASNEYTVQ